MLNRRLETTDRRAALMRVMATAVAVLLAWPQSVAAQSVGPSGCVAYCDEGSGGGGGGYDPYAGMAMGALGAFMQGFMNQMLKQPGPEQRAYALNEQGNAAFDRLDYVEAVRLYEAALSYSPYDSVIRENLMSARRSLGRELEWELEWELERQREEAEAKRKMDTAKRNISQILGDFSQQLDAAESSDPELALMDFNDPKLSPEPTLEEGLGDFSQQLDAAESSDPELALMDFNDLKLSPEPTLEEEKSRVGARLGEIEDKILDAPPGKSAWDGGYGGTLDSPEAAGVSKPVTGAQPVQTGVPRYEKAAPATPTDVAMLGARVSKEEKAKNADAAVSIAGMLAKKEDYDGALRYLKEAKLNNPDQPGLDETIAFVKGMKAADSPELAARLEKSPSPKAEIILDALTVGDGSWESSIRYLEGMKQIDPDNPHVREALNYTRGVYDYQILKQSQTIGPELDKEGPLFFSGIPSSSNVDRPTDEEILKQSQTIPDFPLFIGIPSSSNVDRPTDEEILKQSQTIPDFPLFIGKPPKVDQALLDRFEGPEGRALARHLMDQEVRRILKEMDEKYITTTAGEGLDAIGREDFATAHRIFSSLHQEYPDDINLRDTANYVEGLYDAQQRSH